MLSKRKVKFNGTDKSHVTRSLEMRQKQRESDRIFLVRLSATIAIYGHPDDAKRVLEIAGRL
jgi:hypothetical protein